MSLATLPKTVRTFARLRVIAQVLSKHGFGHFVDRLQLGGYLPTTRLLRRRGPTEEHEALDPLEAIGRRLVRVCEELGPTFIKLGQIASTRADVLPPQVLTALEGLQTDVKPFPTEQAKRIFKKDTGRTVAEAFREFTDQPFASASIAQVHRAITPDGRQVVVKVQRPGIEQIIQLDIYVLKFLAEQAESLFPELRPFRPRMLIEEFTQTLQKELDFINEASATARFHEAFQDDPHVTTPRVHWELTGAKVLTLEYLDGIRLRDVLEERGPTCNRTELARNLSECFLKQFFELGIFHADPHPGNLLIGPPDCIKLVDFGMIGQIDERLTDRLVIGIVAAVKKEVDVLIDILADLDGIGPKTDRGMLARDLRGYLDKYYGLPLRRLDMATIFREWIDTVRRNDVTLPRDFVAMFKSLAVVSGVILQLDPELNLAELLQPRLSTLLRERISGRRILRMAGISTWHIAGILRDAPRLIREIMRGMGRGQFQVNIKHENIDYLARELDRSSNRLASSIIMASTIVGGSMLLSMDTEVTLFKVPIRYLGFVGYALALFMAVWIIVAILRSGKLS
ncbi:MAG: ABC1 kinase family protein [Phycisphaerae bacterium]